MGQMGRSSPLEELEGLPFFKPFKGPDADRVLRKLRDKILPSAPVTENDLRRAVESLSRGNGRELAAMYILQDGLCKRCGACCRTISASIAFGKEELKAASKYLKIPYKKLKRKIRALPLGSKIFNVPGRPCPFLRERNVCTIYEVRPMVCRLYPMGTAALSATITSKLDITPQCPIVRDLLAKLALARLSLEVAYREDPEQFEKFRQFQEETGGRLKDMSPPDRLRAAISTASEIAQALDKHAKE